jgi:hypothetical protein
LLLNPYQSIALQYTNKPNILNVNLNNVIYHYERFCNSGDHKKNLKKLLEYLKEKIQNNSLNETDLKLFEILEEDLKIEVLFSSN